MRLQNSLRWSVFLLIGLWLCLFSNQSSADNGIPSRLAFDIYGGVTYVKPDMSERFVIVPNETDTIHGNDENYEFIGGAGFSIVYFEDVRSTLLMGIDNFYYSTHDKGYVDQYALSQFRNYRYKLDIDSFRSIFYLEVDSKPIGSEKFIWFAKAGAGVAQNRVDFRDVPLSGIDGGGIRIPAKTRTELAYDLAAGVKIPMSKKLKATVQYQFSDQGRFRTGKKGNVTLLKPITVHLTTQSLLLGLNYQIT